jgi:predicted nucleic acid-binding protein
MICGVESNFVLELAFRHEEAIHCTHLLTLAEQKAIQLVIPACALFEPYETLIRREKERAKVADGLKQELQQLARTDTYAELGKTSETVTRTLAESSKEQAGSLSKTIDRVVSIATVIPLDANVIKHSLAIQLAYGLPPQDSVVFASIDQFFGEQDTKPKLFANKNRRDFANDLVEGQLAKHNCKLLPRFSQAKAYIEGMLRK